MKKNCAILFLLAGCCWCALGATVNSGIIRAAAAAQARASGGGGTVPAFVQTMGTNNGANTWATITMTTSNAVTAGNFGVIGFQKVSSSTVSSVTSSPANNWTPVSTPLVNNVAGRDIVVYYATNMASGATTITVTISPAANFSQADFMEYSGVKIVNPLDAWNTNTVTTGGANVQITSGSFTTTVNNDLMVGFAVLYGGTATAGAGFTERWIAGSGGQPWGEDGLQATAGSTSVTYTNDTSGDRSSVIGASFFHQ